MHNPFEILMEKLNQIENLIKSQNNVASDNVMNVEQLAKYWVTLKIWGVIL